jgi:hypothetical protein
MKRLGRTGDTGWPMPPLNRRKTVSFSAGNNLAAEFINIDETLIAASLNTIPPLPKSRFPACLVPFLAVPGMAFSLRHSRLKRRGTAS